jgi:zinc transport system substrate-binding protein
MRIVLVSVCLAALCAGCGGSRPGRPTVASFYPLAYAAEIVGGAPVANLTPAGAEPHDIELTPREVAELQRAKLVVYLSHGFQPAVQQAVAHARGVKLDALSGLSIRKGAGDEAGKADPHVWLDPLLYARIVRRIGGALHRPRAAAALAARLTRLDRDYRRGLAHCERRTFVTSHAAFGYLAGRYGLRQIAITGIDPQSEPSPQKLAELAKLVRRRHIGVVFFERLVSPKLAQTVAREAGATSAVLDPIEGLTPAEADRGETYLSLMRRNLAELRKALRCH